MRGKDSLKETTWLQPSQDDESAAYARIIDSVVKAIETDRAAQMSNSGKSATTARAGRGTGDGSPGNAEPGLLASPPGTAPT
jgi:hypothetical protein